MATTAGPFQFVEKLLFCTKKHDHPSYDREIGNIQGTRNTAFPGFAAAYKLSS